MGVRNRAGAILRNAGFERIGTATYEAQQLDLGTAIDAARNALAELGTSKIDNLWVYIDQPEA